MTLTQLARRTGLSVSFLSQLERGLNRASVTTWRRIALAMEVPLFQLFLDGTEGPWVVRRDQRVSLRFPDSEATYELLSPDLGRRIELVLITLEPGKSTFPEAFSHRGEEVDFVVRGRVRFEVGERIEVLEEGDSIYFDCAIPHRFTNVGHDRAVILSAVTPPTF